MKEAKKEGLQNASESQIEVDQQYVLPDNLDMDVFSKKRQLKLKDADVTDINDVS